MHESLTSGNENTVMLMIILKNNINLLRKWWQWYEHYADIFLFDTLFV